MSTIFYNHSSLIPFSAGSASAPSITFAGDDDTGIYTGGTANTLRFTVGASQKARLDVNGLAVYTGNLYIESGQKLNFDLNVSNNYYLQKSSTTLYMHSPVNLSLQTDGNHRLYINQAGNVGIGTTTPTQKLDVAGHAVIGQSGGAYKYFIKRPSDGSATSYFGYHSADNGDFGISNASGGGNIRFQSNNGALRFYNTSTSAVLFNVANNGNTTVNGDLTVSGTITAQEFRTEFVTQTVIFESGSTAFGNSDDDTHTFTGTLTVNTPSDNQIGNGVRINRPGNYYGGFEFAQNGSVDWSFGVNSSGFGIYENGAAATTRLNIKDGGNVGIGTTSPAYLLDVNGTAKVNTLRVHNSDPGIIFVDSAGSTYDGMFRYRDNYLEWLWGGGIKMRVSAEGGIAISQDYAASSIPTKGLILPGSVGIGLADPAYKLQIGGNAQYIAARNDIGNTSFILGSDSNGDGNFELRDSAGTRMVKLYGEPNAANYIVNGGNFGLGTSSPAAKLHIVGINSANGGIRIHNAGGNPYSIWSDNDRLYFSNGNGSTTAFTISYPGNIGVGVTNPTSKLHVAGTSAFEDTMQVYNSSATNDAVSKGQMLNYAILKLKPSNLNSGTLAFAQVDGGNSIGMQFTNGSGTADWDISMQPFGGRVGIGTVSPDYMFTVAGSNGNFGVGSTGNDLYFTRNEANYFYGTQANSAFRFFTAGVEKLNLGNTNSYFPNGNVGIGTTAPAFKLDVSGSTRIQGADSNSTISDYGIFAIENQQREGIGFGYDADGNTAWIYAREVGIGSRALNVNGSVFIANYGGNVGIGTNSPGYKLDVNGGIRATGVTGTNTLDLVAPSSYIRLQANANNIFHDAGGNHYFRTAGGASTSMIVTSGGQVGIGTTSPGAKLDVAGQVSLDSDLYIGADGGANYTASRLRLYSHDNYRGAGMHMTGVDSNWFIGTPYTDFAGSFIIARKGVATSEEDTAQLSNAMFTVRSSGWVGIGTTDPRSKLEVKNGTTGQSYTNQSGLLIDVNGTSNSYSSLHVGSNSGANNFVVTNAGNTGLGTASPARKLHVGGVGGSSGGIMLSPSSGDVEVQFQDSGTTNAYITLKDGTQQMRFRDDAANVFNVDFGTERVGINTTAPDSKLTIRDTSNVYVDIQGDGNVEAGIRMRYQNNSSAGSKIFYNTPNAVVYYDNLYTYNAGQVWGAHSFRNRDESGTLRDRLYIERGGNIGIGTTTPSANLEVYGSGSTVLDIQGSQGQLFSVSDSLTGSLMSVNDISGLPILEVFDTDKVVMGEYGTNALVVTGSNVGIGTDTPSAPLEATIASGRVANFYSPGGGTVGFTNGVIDSNSSQFGFKAGGGNKLYLGANGGQHLTISTTGNVGIGTTSPSTDLEVVNSQADILVNSTTAGEAARLRVKTTSREYRLGTFSGQSDNFWIYDVQAGAYRMAIDTSGNVGIGTTTPQSKLDVAGPITLGGDTEHQLSKITTSAITSEVTDVTELKGRQIDLYAYDDVHVRAGTGDNVHIYAQGTERFRIGSDVAVISSTDFNITGTSRRLNFTSGTGTVRTTSNNALYLATNNANRVTITGGGAVGIGTTSPNFLLDVAGDAAISGGNRLWLKTGSSIGVENAAGTNAIYIANTGTTGSTLDIGTGTMVVVEGDSVGIGTTSPAGGAFKLDVNGYIKANSRVYVRDSTKTVEIGTDYIQSYITSGTGVNPIRFFTGSTEKARVDGNGNVGIGTTSPAYKLHVEGEAYFSDGNLRSNNSFDFLTTGGSAQKARFGGIQVSTSYSGNTPDNGIGFYTDNILQRTAADQLTYSTTGGLGYLLPGANPGYFIGSDSRRWEIVFCNILDSAGLHEKNLENPEGEKQVGEYATGTVLVWKGGKNVPCTVEADHMRMGVAVEGMNSPLVQGAEPVLVTGIANEGDYLISSEKEGHARAISRQEMLERNLYDCVLGKALESGEGESYLLKVWITI